MVNGVVLAREDEMPPLHPSYDRARVGSVRPLVELIRRQHAEAGKQAERAGKRAGR